MIFKYFFQFLEVDFKEFDEDKAKCILKLFQDHFLLIQHKLKIDKLKQLHHLEDFDCHVKV